MALRRVEDTTIYSFPYAFISRRGEPILVTTLDEERCRLLTEMYLAYEPRDSFQGLPPIKDDACVRWVQETIAHAVNLVALSFGHGVVGHVAVFPVEHLACEILVVVAPSFQNTGIGTSLVRCSVQLADEIGFERMRLSVESKNDRARHVYKKCGFEYVSDQRSGELNMALDLKRYRDSTNVTVSEVMNHKVVSIRADQPCRMAVEIFLNTSVASLPVVDDENRVKGIISKSDLLISSKIAKNVCEVLTREVLTVRPEEPLDKVIRMFQSKGIRAIPVVDRAMRLSGVIGRKDILAYYAKKSSPDG